MFCGRGPTAIKQQFTERVLSPMARLQRFRFDIPPLVTSGSVAWHLRKEVPSVVESALVRMAELFLHLFRPEGEPWVEWHVRTYHHTKTQLSLTWGGRPAVIIAANGSTR